MYRIYPHVLCVNTPADLTGQEIFDVETAKEKGVLCDYSTFGTTKNRLQFPKWCSILDEFRTINWQELFREMEYLSVAAPRVRNYTSEPVN